MGCSSLLTVIPCCLLLSGCQATKQRRIIPFYVDPESFLSKEQYFYVDEFNHAQEPVSEQVWDRALPFKNGVGLVVDNDLWGVVDEKCN